MDKNKTKAQLLVELEQAQKRIAELEAASSREDRERFISVFHASPSQMALTDSVTGRYVEVNEAFLRILGFERDEVLGKTALELNLFINPVQRAELLQRAAAQGYLRGEHVLVRAKTGEIRHGIFSAEYVHANGQKLFLTVMNDITEKIMAEERWQFALEGVGDGVWDLDAQTNRVFFSRQWKSMLGYEDSEIGESLDEWSTRVHPDDLAATMAKVNAHLEGKTPAYSSEHRVRCKDGTYKWILGRGKVIEWTKDNQPLRVIGTHKDISEQKAAEASLRESEERFSRMFHANPAAQLIVSAENGVILDANEAYCRQSGFTHAELVGHTTREFNLWADPALQTKVAQQLRVGKPVHSLEAEFRNKAGEKRILLASFEPVELKGVQCIISSAVDITERKQAEQALQQSEIQYHSLVDALDVSLCRWLSDTTLTYANEKYKRIFGIHGQATGQKWLNFLPEEARAATASFYGEVVENPRTVTYEHPVTVEDGSVREYQWIDTPILDEQGEVVEFQSVGIDITERKKADEALQEAEMKYRLLVEQSPSIVYVDEIGGPWQYISPQLEIVTGYKPEEFIQKRGLWKSIVHPDDWPRLARETQIGIEKGHRIVVEYRIFARDGRTIWFHDESNSFQDPKTGKVILRGVFYDITQHKRAEELIATSEAQTRALLNATPDAMVIVNAAGIILIANAQAEKTFGFTQSELVGSSVENLIPAAVRNLHVENRARFMHQPRPVTSGIDKNILGLRKNGEKFPAEISLSHHKTLNGEPVVLCSLRDVTEQNRAKALIAAQRDLARLTSVNLPKEQVWANCFQAALNVSSLDSGGIYLYNGDSRGFELVIHKGLGKTFLSAIARIEDETPNAQMVLSGKTFYFTALDLNAQPYYLAEGMRSIAAIPIQHNGQILGCLNVASHVFTEIPEFSRNALETIAVEIGNIIIHQNMEEDLRASREQLNQALMAARMGTWRWHIPTNRIEWSPEAVHIFGANHNGDDFNTVLAHFHPEDRPRLASSLQTALSQQKLLQLEYRVLGINGKTTWITNYGHIEYDAEGRPLVMMGLIQDITERKLAEEKLRASEERYRMLAENMTDIIWMTDTAFHTVYISPSLTRLCGYTLEEMNELPIEKLTEPASLARAMQLFAEYTDPEKLAQITGPISASIDLEYYKKDGATFWCENTFTLIRDENGVPTHILGSGRDITTRKRVQEELRFAEQRYRALIENAPDGIMLANADGKFKYTSPTVERLLGYTQTELAEMNPLAIIHPEDQLKVYNEFAKTVQEPAYISTLQYRHRHKNGEWRWVESVYRNLLDFPSVEAFVINFRDITDRKQAEEQIHRQMEDMAFINALNEAANRGESLEKISEILSQESRRIFHCRDAAVYLMSPDRQSLVLQNITLPKPFRLRIEKLLGGPFPKIQLPIKPESFFHRIINSDHGMITSDPQLLQRWMSEFADTPFLPEATRSLIKSLIPRIFKFLGIRSVITIPLKSGNLILGAFEISSSELFSESELERLQNVRASLTEILRRKQVEQALKLSEEKYRGLMESLDNAVSTVDYEGRFLYMNDMGAEKLGGTPQDYIGKTMKELFPEPLASYQIAGIQSIFHTGQKAVFESQSMGKEKSLRWYRFALQPLHDEFEHINQVLINATDIHELKTAQQDLQDLNRTLEERVQERTAQVQDLYDNAPAGYLSLDDGGRITAINQTELNWLGYSRDELLGMPITAVLTPQTIEHFEKDYHRFTVDGKVSNLEIEVLRKDGTTFPAMIEAVAVYDENGKYVTNRSTMTDITQRKQAEDALRLANLELQRAMRVKDEFLASMSHELRTPLNAILGLSESMLEQFIGPLNERQLRSMETIETSGRHLLELINDILNLSKLEANQVALELTPVSVREACEASLLFIKDLAHKKNIQVNSAFDPAVVFIQADERRLKQMLVNLLSNAIKFTPEGGMVELQVAGNQEEQMVSFSVSDTGIGISPENLPRLFQPFVQLDSGLNRQFEGTGLGLSLVARMAQLHDGGVTAQSKLGQGSCFTITLPWRKPVPAAKATVNTPHETAAIDTPGVFSTAANESPLILIAEDNESSIVTLSMYLQAKGYRLAIARNGNEALEYAHQKRPAVILMDLQMPVLDGLESIRRLRADSDPHIAGIPVIALTALAMPADRERSLKAGANEYLSKPVNLKQLAELINRLSREH